MSYVQFDQIKGDIFSTSHCRGQEEIHNSNRFLLFVHHRQTLLLVILPIKIDFADNLVNETLLKYLLRWLRLEYLVKLR